MTRTELEVEQVLFTGRVREVMQTNVLTCPPEETVVGVARRMTNLGVGSAVVVDDMGVPTGIVTDRDFRSKVLASGEALQCPGDRRHEPAGPVHLSRCLLF